MYLLRKKIIDFTMPITEAILARARRVEVLPTVVDTSRYPLAAMHGMTVPFRVGWIGTPITWAAYGEALLKELSEAFSNDSVEFVAIGASTVEQHSGRIKLLPWSEATEGDLIASLSVGLMPLEDTPWARGKCAYKLIQYLASGVPVIASPVGANCDVVRDGENGVLATSFEEWRAAVARLSGDPLLARRMGLIGRDQIEQHYSVSSAGLRLVDMVVSAFPPASDEVMQNRASQQSERI